MNTPRLATVSLAAAIACAGAVRAGDAANFTESNLIIADATGAAPMVRAYALAGAPDMLGNADLSRFMAMEMGDGGKVVKDAPYSAEAVTETTQTLADGNRISRRTATLLYRDALGRTRQEQTAPGSTIFLNDPVSGRRTILNTDKKTATVLPGFGRFTERLDMSKLHEMAKLGKAQVIRKSADGEKQTIAKGADGEMQIIRKTADGEIGNDKPIQIVSEKWFSPELQTVVYSRHSDPRSGETIYRMNNIRRAAQPPELFAVPSGYQIKETSLPALGHAAPAPPAPPAR